MQKYAQQARQDAYVNGDFAAIERIIDGEYREEPVRKRKGPLHPVDPGAGAIAYAYGRVAGLTREEAAPIIREFLENLPADKRVKRCDYCGFPYRDDSLRNTKRTCCDECKTALKTIQKRQQRADNALITGKTKKRTKREEYYVWWLEYPFWLDEYEMLKRAWKHEATHNAELLDYIHGQREIYGEGNRKIMPKVAGAEDEKAGRKFNAWTRQKMRG